VRLPRPITNCLSTVELGANGLELSAAKFYPRALAPNELADIYAGGAPLSEIATSTVLRPTTEDSFAGLQFSTAASAAGTADTLATENARTAASLLVSKRALGESDDVRDAALYLVDESPAAPLFLAPEIASLLPPRELARWIAQGSLSAAVAGPAPGLVEAWRNEPAMGQYWSMWEGALYVENYGQVHQHPFLSVPSPHVQLRPLLLGNEGERW
jgi:hypothetical protein